jgi:hydrogenase nickel incorporation protein HypA/HybF
MHELSVCQALIEQVERVARERQAERVVAMVVRIGPLSGIEPALLRSAYPFASAGTVAADAALVLEWTAVRVRCLECGAESETQSNCLLCAACGHWRTQVLCGEELLLASVELEVSHV